MNQFGFLMGRRIVKLLGFSGRIGANSKMSKEENFVYKIAIVGDAGVGKTAITLRFLYDEYEVIYYSESVY